MTRYKDFDDADDFLAMAECALVSEEADLLDEIDQHGLSEDFGQWMFQNSGDYCDVDGYDFVEMILRFCRIKEIVAV